MKTLLNGSTGENIRIVVIDSGANRTHSLLKNVNISDESFSVFSDKTGGYGFSKDINDEFGHGTAVCGILAKLVPESIFIIAKIFDEASLRADENKLITALKYVIENIECDMIHMSLGTVLPCAELENLCKIASAKGIFMVSAYDNAGAISYPANYPEVIGVDVDNRCIKAGDFMVIESDNITVLAKGGNHRLAWVNPPYIISQGSSFSAAYVTAYAAKMLASGIDKSDIIDTFKKISLKSVKLKEQPIPNVSQVPFRIQNAILFPYNKEMHSLVNYADYLPFHIKMICDSKYTGRINKRIQSLNGKHTYSVNSIDQVCWDEVDTLILGHLNDLESSIGQKIRKEILDICLLNRVNVYAFDDLDAEISSGDFIREGCYIYTPKINTISYLKKYMGKMFQFSKPVVGVFGTSSHQGKFTLQLSLRYVLKSLGYSVAQIGSEPSALLFNLDACYPFGYNSTVKLDQTDSILAINHLVHEVEMKRDDADIIIIGSQSGTVPTLYNNIGQMTIQQLAFLMGAMPDVVILCVNADDEIDVILRSIKAIEGVGNTSVIALALYPLSYTNSWQMMNNKRERIQNIDEVIHRLNTFISIPVFVIGSDTDTYNLCNLLIENLSEDDEEH